LHEGLDDKPLAVSVTLTSPDRDVPSLDALDMIRQIIHGFCAMLSALPVDLWNIPHYEKRDAFLGELGSTNTYVRFFPLLK
jgi:hypothetical protein